MALPSLLSLVNDVLVRMREPEVSTINENVLSKLVSKYVNDSKRQVEDSYNWNTLSVTLTVNTTNSVFNYALVGTGARFKVIDAYNNTNRFFLTAQTARQMTMNLLQNTTPQRGSPYYYNFNGANTSGDTQVEIYPIPDGVYTLYFNLFVPQTELVLDADIMLVPKEPVVLLAYARSLVERGEDGGLNSSEAYAMYKSVLSDYIALEASRYPEEECWVST